VVAPHILKREVWEAMEGLEETLARELGVDEERIAAVAKRAGNSSEGKPPRPRANDPIGTARYFTDIFSMIVEVLSEQERRISDLAAKK
jgi:hypothetical protein